MSQNTEENEFGQAFPDYDCSQEVPADVEAKVKARKPSGEHTREQKTAQQARWYARNRSRWNAYQRDRKRRLAAAKQAVRAGEVPSWLDD
jgi:hypothetical protein